MGELSSAPFSTAELPGIEGLTGPPPFPRVSTHFPSWREAALPSQGVKLRYPFDKSRRILDGEEFALVFKTGRREVLSHMKAYRLPKDAGPARLGVSVSKKTAKRANARNYIKRRLREWFRTRPELMMGDDVVILVTKAFKKEDFPPIEKELDAWISNPDSRKPKKRKQDGAPSDPNGQLGIQSAGLAGQLATGADGQGGLNCLKAPDGHDGKDDGAAASEGHAKD